MSVILDLSLFPLDQGASLSRFVAPVIAMIQETGLPYHLSPMGTQIETETLPEALALIERAQAIVEGMGAKRIYAVAKFDIREGPMGRLSSKIESVQAKLERPNTST